MRHRAKIDERARLLSIDPCRLYPDESERYVAEVFNVMGFTVQVLGQTGDQAVDVLAERPGLRLAIQAKRYQDAVGNAAVQQVFAGMHHHRCQRCAVVATGGFTRAAAELAHSTGCLLIGREQLTAMIRSVMAI